MAKPIASGKVVLLKGVEPVAVLIAGIVVSPSDASVVPDDVGGDEAVGLVEDASSGCETIGDEVVSGEVEVEGLAEDAPSDCETTSDEVVSGGGEVDGLAEDASSDCETTGDEVVSEGGRAIDVENVDAGEVELGMAVLEDEVVLVFGGGMSLGAVSSGRAEVLGDGDNSVLVTVLGGPGRLEGRLGFPSGPGGPFLLLPGPGAFPFPLLPSSSSSSSSSSSNSSPSSSRSSSRSSSSSSSSGSS